MRSPGDSRRLPGRLARPSQPRLVDGVTGPGALIDTNRWCAPATNVLAAAAGPLDPVKACDGRACSRFLQITVRDQVNQPMSPPWRRCITEVAVVTGGLMGGARAGGMIGYPTGCGPDWCWPWGARGATDDQIGTRPPRCRDHRRPQLGRAGITAQAAPDTAGLQRWHRRFAHLTHRGEAELGPVSAIPARTMRTRCPGSLRRPELPGTPGRQPTQRRFDAGSYADAHRALSNHDVAVVAAESPRRCVSCPVPAVVGGITSDRLYPLRLQQELADLAAGSLNVVSRSHGHDGF